MTKRPSIQLDRQACPITAIFGEANAEQRQKCYELGASAFRAPLSATQYLEREEYLGSLPLTRGTGWRFWCVFDVEDPLQIFATCKTLHRDLIVRDASNTHVEKGYCIASVVTDQKFRQKGLATFLLSEVAWWMDEVDGSTVSFLYASRGIHLFYQRLGWDAQPAYHATISSRLRLGDGAETVLPTTRPLLEEDISALCSRDLKLTAQIVGERRNPTNSVELAVLPTADLVSWLQDRAAFISSKLFNKVPQFQGSISKEGIAWIFWCHDFRKNQLAVQRIYGADDSNVPIDTIARLLLDARAEAAEWNFTRVVIWSPSPRLQEALASILQECDDEVVLEEERDYAVCMLRWKGGNTAKSVLLLQNEFYAWN
ncbi:hypothetical protein S7711_10060 [Stachybotrys chartarum IBT 7711]|uniref:LYC1 C-terminal domain-containing protein n=1 Tax=Stachybotrys chartarum (strain CBS 109288 / IBT 7711) TaxID=1280523 RepID=A0A084B2Q1_STACB|nr:hypothetical protein S7711_10060 [Stachybotrys chartarum IBT 7711]KFA45452.1 hypothetical protein S40293_10152 [Stachybotrys chartarum IBT 40293]